MRAIILHGLSLGLNADPAVLERLGADDARDDNPRLSRPRRGRGGKGRSTARPSLYCASITYEGGGVGLQAFHASSPLAIALVPGAVSELLREVERHSEALRYISFSYDTEQRLEA